jgi:PEP-CTERM motif
MKLHFGLSIFVLTTAILTAGSSRAATFSVSAISGALGNSGTVIQPFSVNQFNPSLGTLNSITILQSSSGSGKLAFENTSSAQVKVNYSLAAIASLQEGITASANPFLNFFSSGPISSTTLSPYDGVTDYQGGSGRTYQSQVISSSPISSLVNAESIGLFQGNGQVTLSTRLYGAFSIGSATGFQGVSKYTIDQIVSYTITYDYTPIPEPSTVLGMSLSGAFGLAFYRKKRSKSLV